MSENRRPVTRVTCVAALIGILGVGIPARLTAQADTARVTYRTREVVFFAAGREAGVAVGDTVLLLGSGGESVARAVVVSTARASASARLIEADAAVVVGQLVRFTPRPRPEVAAITPPPDSLAQPPPAESAWGGGSEPAPPPRPAPRWRGGLQLEQVASATGGIPSLSTSQTMLGLDLVAPLARGVELRLRSTGRWRGGASASTTGLEGATAIVYQLETRIAPESGRWNASLGRLAPAAVPGLGYVDGALLEVRLSDAQRAGVVAGFVPRVERLRPATTTRRAAAFWSVAAGAFDGGLAAAADWADGAHRRTQLSGRTFWRAAPGLSLSAYGDADLAAAWRPDGGAQLTTLYASARMFLPLGLRAGLGVESHRAVRLWDTPYALDTMPLPGRLTGLNASLGRDVAGVALDASGGWLKRAGDVTATLRGSFSASRGAVFLMATGQHGDLFDYGAVTGRVFLAPRALPFSASLAASAAATRTANGGLTFWRYSVRPELSQTIGRGLLVTLGGDVGRYAGRTSTWLHAGVSYRFR